jgi:hypothetical protein
MPAIGQIVVADATPTNHTFDPISASVGSSQWVTGNALTYAGNETIEVKMARPTATRKTTRVTVLFAKPIEVTNDGITTVTDIARANMEFIIPTGMTTDDAGHFHKEVANLLDASVIQSYIKDRKPAF